MSDTYYKPLGELAKEDLKILGEINLRKVLVNNLEYLLNQGYETETAIVELWECYKNSLGIDLIKTLFQILDDIYTDNFCKVHGAQRNGYRQRVLKGTWGDIVVSVSRVRGALGKQHQNPILTPYKKYETDLTNRAQGLKALGLSAERTSAALSVLNNVKYPPSTISEHLIQQNDELWQNWLSSPIEGGVMGIKVDACYTKVRKLGQKKAVILAMALYPNGLEQCVGIYIKDNESEQTYSEVFQDLKKRGIPQDLKYLISDNHKGLLKAKQTEFPSANHQSCYFHDSRLMGKAGSDKDNLLPKEVKAVQDKIKRILDQANSSADARIKLLHYINSELRIFAPEMAKVLQRQLTSLTAHLDAPKNLHFLMRTNNTLERLNGSIKHLYKSKRSFPNLGALLRSIVPILAIWNQQKAAIFLNVKAGLTECIQKLVGVLNPTPTF